MYLEERVTYRTIETSEEEVTTDITTKKLRNENPRNLEPDTEFVKPEEGELVETKVEETIEIIEKKPDELAVDKIEPKPIRCTWGTCYLPNN